MPCLSLSVRRSLLLLITLLLSVDVHDSLLLLLLPLNLAIWIATASPKCDNKIS